jgi:hypothetical protein
VPCFHVAVEHAQAVIVLAGTFLDASAMALGRCVTENYVRALWLLKAASVADIERASADELPTFECILADVERLGLLGATPPSRFKPSAHAHPCRFAQTASYASDTRVVGGKNGLDDQDATVLQTVVWAETLALLSLRALAELADDDTLAGAALDRLRGEVVRFS